MAGKEEQKNGLRYDAFISYRHAPGDSEAAMRIQRDLEHFHIPGAIRRQTGRERIGRIFRDKEEMSLTADLGEEIEEALAASRYLIVICSPRTMESSWVSREIHYFLTTHTIDHVLTVIIEGEPEDVLPARLLKGGKEPLSADYRLSPKKAQREELPRIAAALLECRYDDLMHRAQQYRLRRFAMTALAVAACSAAAALYLFWSRTQISESLRQVQVSRARYLSGEVEALLEENRDITAAQLALYTVPENRNLTPPQSWKALADASWAYILPSAERSVKTKAVGELNTADTVRIFNENRDQNRICAADASGHVYVWDAGERKTILSFQNTEEVHTLALAGEQLLVGDGKQLSAYDLSTGKRSWTLDGETAELETGPDETAVAALRFEGTIKHLSIVDPKDGTRTADIPLTSAEEETEYSAHLTVDGDGTYAALCMRNQDTGLYTVQICNLATGKPLKTTVRLYAVNEISFLENGDLFVRGSEDKENARRNRTDEADADSAYETIGDTADTVYCIDPASRTVKWTADLSYSRPDHRRVKAGYFTYTDDGTQKKAVYAAAADVLQLYDAETGEILQRWELSDEISCLEAPDENENDFQAICSDGTRNAVTIGEKDIFCVRGWLAAGSGKVLPYTAPDHNDGFFAAGGDYILQYEAGTYDDPEYTKLSDSGEVLFTAVTEDAWLTVQYSQGYSGGAVLNIYDRESRKLRDTFQLKKKLTGPEDILGQTQDGTELIYTDGYKTGIWAVSTEDGKSRELTVPLSSASGEEETSFRLKTGTGMCLAGDRLYYISSTGNFCMYDVKASPEAKTDAETGAAQAKTDSKAAGSETCSDTGTGISSFSCVSGEEKKGTGDGDAQPSVCALSVSPDAAYGFASFDNGTSLLLDLQKKEVKAVIRTREALYTEVYPGTGNVDWDLSGDRFAVAGKREMVLCDLDGNILKEMNYSGGQAAGLHFYHNLLLVAYMDGKLNRYSCSDGSFIGSTQIDVSEEAAAGEGSFWTDRKDGTILLSVSSYANVIDTGEWAVCYSIPFCLASDPENRIFLVGEGTDLGYFPEYTLDELMEKCRQAANNEEPDEETLARYGLTRR